MVNGIGIDTSEVAIKALVEERKKNPNYRDQVLENMIEREMFLNASADLCKEDYRIRCEEWSKQQQKESFVHQTVCSLCEKISKLFK